MYLEGIILYCNNYIQQDRSIQSIYHLLKGKMGIQTVHDARIFGLEKFFGIYKSLNQELFDLKIKSLLKQNFLELASKENNLYMPTKKGTDWLAANYSDLRLNYFSGMQLHKVTEEFFERLQLIIQTYTNIKMNHNSFIPVIDTQSVAKWVKIFYKKMASVSSDQILLYLYEDLHYLLQFLSNQEAEFFLDHLTGYRSYGKSSAQLTEKYSLQESDLKILQIAILQRLLQLIDREYNNLKILPLIKRNNPTNQSITQSAMITYTLLEKGLSLNEISIYRKLKINTVFDHLVEIVLFNPTFPIDDYVNAIENEAIQQAIAKTQSKKLKDIKANVSDSISYFQIRLVLAKTSNQL